MSNFPKREKRPHLEVPFPHLIKFIQDNDEEKIIGIIRQFKSRKDMAENTFWLAEQIKKLNYYQKELEMIKKKCDLSSSLFPDEYLWRRIIDIAVEIEWWDLKTNFEKEIIIAAKKLGARSQGRFEIDF